MRTEEEIIKEIMELVVELGWSVVIPSDSEVCDGMIIGNNDFLKDMNLDVGDTKNEMH